MERTDTFQKYMGGRAPWGSHDAGEAVETM